MRRMIGIVLILIATVFARIDAGEMAFKFNKRIWPLDFPYPKGINLVALPWVNPYDDAEDLCKVFSLVPGKGRISQMDAGSGRIRSHTCGDYDPFRLLPSVGVVVANPVETNG